ncbi:relaxase/mobilization nuclease domain-containing protein [Streptomyces kaniharaensis]|uniref:relaxase/mobilization nuclease domain-containing protein n=1 Tax=Streptomyces kaniharaensis TaxID=212423 RepID=UPI001296D778|nr:relaxase/mobilization nuclease domain-containing protein [Streptomyces kaniharaensis]
MIAKITKGARAGGALRYDFGPGNRDEHKEPRFIAGNVAGTRQQVARLIDHHARQRSDIKKPIWRCSLSLPDEDGVLKDEVFAEIAEKYVARMGFAGCPWVAVRHGDDHIHLTVCRIDWNGKVVSDWQDFDRSRPVVRALEAEYGLTNAEERSNRVAPQVGGTELAAAARRGVALPEREQLRLIIWEARDAAAGRGQEAFEAELATRGVEFRANVAKTGKMSGYAFSLPGWVDAEGQQIWVRASNVAKDLSWTKLEPVLKPPTGHVEAPVQQPQAAISEPSQVAEEIPALNHPYALATGPELAEQHRAATRAVATRTQRLVAEQQTEARLTDIAAGTSPGAAALALADRRDRLEAAVQYLAVAEQHRAQAEAQLTQARAASRVAEQAEAMARRPDLVLRLARTSQAQQQGLAAAGREHAAQAEERARAEQAAQNTATAAAQAAAPGVRDPLDALAQLNEQWSPLLTQAHRQDEAQARARLAEHRPVVQAARSGLVQARQAVSAIEAEAARRRQLTPDQARAEEAIRARTPRTDHQAAALGERTVASVPQQQARPRQDVSRGSGPGLGIG